MSDIAPANDQHVALLGGEMRSRIYSFEWSTKSLGPIADWPQSLKIAADLMLASGHAMMPRWGRAEPSRYRMRGQFRFAWKLDHE